MGLIIFAHPRCRSNLLCSHLEDFPKEIFHLSKVNAQSELDWTSNHSPEINKSTGVADCYLEKIKEKPPQSFKLFGFHLEEWSEVLPYIHSLNYDVLRVYRENKLDAIISLLLGLRRGFTSFSQKDIKSFQVDKKHFDKAYDMVVTFDDKWKNEFKFSAEIEYNDLPGFIQSGKLKKYGVQTEQLYPLENQKSLEASPELILNLEEVKTWYKTK